MRLLCLAIFATLLAADSDLSFAQSSTLRPSIVNASTAWSSVATANFRVWADDPKLAQDVAESCERQRAELRDYWQGSPTSNQSGGTKTVLWSPERWSTPCDVVVHPTQNAYRQAVGPGSERSFGSSYWRVVGGRVCARRIDLRSDQRDPRTAALPHELTHVVLADRMCAKPMPRWLDEGIAVLADVPEKQQGHERDWQRALLARRVYRLNDLTAIENYPPAEQMPLFYGQSASLVRDLLQRGTPTQLLDFAEQARDQGCDAAIRGVYAIGDAGAWEAEWIAAQNRDLADAMTTSIER